jgi:hypothetical protein
MHFADPMRGACYDPATLFASALASVKTMSLGTILQVAGAGVSAVGAVKSGNAAQASAEYQALQLEAAGKTENAVAQREAEEQRRQKEFMLSRARAVGAASGGGQDIGLMGAIEEEGELRALTALWEGEEAAKGRNMQASAARDEGQQMKSAGMVKGFSTILSSVGQSFAEKFG